MLRSSLEGDAALISTNDKSAAKEKIEFQMGMDEGLPFHLTAGFSAGEINHRWTDGKEAILTAPLFMNNKKVSMIVFDTEGLVSEKISQTMIVSIGCTVVKSCVYDFNNPTHTLCIDISACQNKSVTIHFKMPNACQPCKVKTDNKDPRELAISFKAGYIILNDAHSHTKVKIEAPDFSPLQAIKEIANNKRWDTTGTYILGWSKIPEGISDIRKKSATHFSDLVKIIQDRLAKSSGFYFQGSRSNMTIEFYNLILRLDNKDVNVQIYYEAINEFCKKWELLIPSVMINTNSPLATGVNKTGNQNTSAIDSQKNADKPNPYTFYANTDAKKPLSYNAPFEKAENPLATSAWNAYQEAKTAAICTLPIITYAGIQMMQQKSAFLDLRILGLPVAVGGAVIDVIKAPFTAAVCIEEGIRAGIMGLLSLVFEGNPVEDEINRIFLSFLLRMRQAAMVMESLKLEEPGSMERKLASGDIAELVGYALLLTAYVSRNAGYGILLLANGFKLRHEDCPVAHRELFDNIIGLKESIVRALSLTQRREINIEARELSESNTVCEWIRLIKAAKQIYTADKHDATPEQIAAANDVIKRVNDIRSRAMAALPKAPADVARQVSQKI